MTELIISVGSFLVTAGVLIAIVAGMVDRSEEFGDEINEDARQKADRRG